MTVSCPRPAFHQRIQEQCDQHAVMGRCPWCEQRVYPQDPRKRKLAERKAAQARRLRRQPTLLGDLFLFLWVVPLTLILIAAGVVTAIHSGAWGIVVLVIPVSLIVSVISRRRQRR